MDEERVVEVFAPTPPGSPDRFGSGYLLSGTLVLTAGHVVDPAREGCKVRPLGQEKWLEVEEVVWRGKEHDAALLRIPAQSSERLARFGRLASRERVPCEALGFPLAQAGSGKRAVRDSEEIQGKIVPRSRTKSRRLTIHIAGSVPAADDSGHSPWEGMSGAALFVGPLIVGIVSIAPANFGTDRLEAVSIVACAEEPELRDAFRRESGVELELDEVGGRGHLPAETTVTNFLGQYLGADRPFAGRDAELARLDDWLDDPQRPYLLVAGRPGRGKSALLAHWWERCREKEAEGALRSVFVPVSIRYGLTDQRAVLKAAVARLADVRDEESGPAEESVDGLRDRLGALLSHAPPAGQRTLLIVDGIDEAAGWTPGPGFFPNPPAAGVKVVVSARLTPSRSTVEDWLRHLGWGNDLAATVSVDDLSREATRAVIESADPALSPLAEPESVEQLYSVSGGDPLVLGLYLRHLSRQGGDLRAAVDSLATSEPGLGGFMERWWEDQESQWRGGDAGGKVATATVLNLLACALGPLERGQLLALAKRMGSTTGDDLSEAIRALDRMVVRESTSYALAHPRLATHRVELLRGDGELEQYEALFAAWGRETLAGLREGRLPPAEAPAYVVRHYREHLDRIRHAHPGHADATAERYLEMVDPAWRVGWEAVADRSSGYIDDVEAARHVAAVADVAAVRKGEVASFAAEEIWCSYVRAEHARTLELVGGELAGRLVEHGVWTERRALDACEGVEDDWTRARALVALVPHLGPPGLRQVVGLLPACAREDCLFLGDAVEQVAAGLARAGELDEARAFAEAQEPGDVRAFAILGLLPVAPEPERASLLESAWSHLFGRRLPSELLVSLTRAVDLDLAREVLDDDPSGLLAKQLRDQTNWWSPEQELEDLEPTDRAYVLGYLGPWLPVDRLEAEVAEVLAGMARESTQYNVGEAMEDLAPYLRGTLLHRAVNLVEDLLAGEGAPQTVAWTRLLEAPGGPGHERLMGLILPRLDQLFEYRVGPRDVREALALVSRHGAADACLRAVIGMDESSRDKPEYLTAIAPHLDLPMTCRALLATVRHQDRQETTKALLARLGTFGPDQAREALALASRGEEADEMRAALAVLSHVGAGPMRLDDLLAIEDAHLRLAALATSSRIATATAVDLRRALPRIEPDRDYLGPLALELFDEMRRALPDAEIRGEVAASVLDDVAFRGSHPRKEEFVAGCQRQMAEAAQADEDRDEHPRAEPTEHLDPAEVELYPARLLRLIRALPDEHRPDAVRRLVPDELLSGTSFANLEAATWGDHMAELAPVLELDQARLLRGAAIKAKSGSTSSKVRAAVAARIGVLGYVSEAIEGLALVESEHAAMALCELIGTAAADEVPGLIDVTLERFDSRYRGERARVWAVASRRLPELSGDRQLRLLQEWLERRPSRSELLVDLLLFAPVVVALGGSAAAEELSLRLDPVRGLPGRVGPAGE